MKKRLQNINQPKNTEDKSLRRANSLTNDTNIIYLSYLKDGI